MSKSKVRVQLLDEKTGSVLEEVDVLTSAEAVSFSDGDTFQDKLNKDLLKGPKGDPGNPGQKGDQGKQGPPGLDGNSVKYGTDINNSSEVKIFFKKI